MNKTAKKKSESTQYGISYEYEIPPPRPEQFHNPQDDDPSVPMNGCEGEKSTGPETNVSKTKSFTSFLNRQRKSLPDFSDNGPVPSPTIITKDQIKVPKWYQLHLRAQLKKDIIQHYLDEYATPVQLAGKETFKPTDMDIKEYYNELYKLSLKQLLLIGEIREAKPVFTMTDRISRIKKRKALLATIYHKNGSRTHYVIAKHTRIVKINEHKYLCPPNMGNYDNKYGMMSYVWYENNPFPVQFVDDYKSTTPEGVTIPDGELLQATMDFEFAQKLAHSSMSAKVNLAMVFAILGFVMGCINTVLLVTGFKMI